MIYVINWFVNILTLGLVSIATITTTTYHVDDPITELNNQSLNDVFLDANLFGHNYWDIDYTYLYDYKTGGYVHQDDYLKLQNINTNVGISYYNINYTLGDKLYFHIKSESNYSQGTNFGTRLVYRKSTGSYISAVSFNLGATTLSQNSGITYSTHVDVANIELRHLLFNQPNDSVYKVYQNLIVNLTDLGIDNLTQAQMDDWYNIYVQANANNGVYIESTSHLNNNIHLVDVSVMVISFGFWVWLIKFLKGVII